MYRFTRVNFDLNSSLFSLNGTLKVQFSKFLHQQRYENLILEKLLRYLYVDDVASSFSKVKQAFRFYETSKDILSTRGFELRNSNTNYESLQDFINNDTKETINEKCIKKILGLDWNITSNEFIFCFTDIVNTVSNLLFTKKICFKTFIYVFRPIGTNISHSVTDLNLI